MTTEEIPSDFPYLRASGVVSGAQAKLLLNVDEDGTFHESGNSPDERRARCDACHRIIEWATPFLTDKTLKPKYASMPKAQILARFQNNLRLDFGLAVEDQLWVRAKVAARLGWVDDPTTSAGC